MTNIKFKDALVPVGGVITLGLDTISPQGDEGLRWSLSLSHLRYYGNPTEVSSSEQLSHLRITMNQLHLVALGSLFDHWKEWESDSLACIEFLGALGAFFGRTATPYLKVLCTAARHVLDLPDGAVRSEALRLIAFGRRNGQKFLYESTEEYLPAFGFADPAVL